VTAKLQAEEYTRQEWRGQDKPTGKTKEYVFNYRPTAAKGPKSSRTPKWKTLTPPAQQRGEVAMPSNL